MSPLKPIKRSDLNKALPPTPPVAVLATPTEHAHHFTSVTDNRLIYVVLDINNDDQHSPIEQANKVRKSTRTFPEAASAWSYAVQCGKDHGVGVTLTAPAPGDANYLEYLNVAGVLYFTTTVKRAPKLDTKATKTEVQDQSTSPAVPRKRKPIVYIIYLTNYYGGSGEEGNRHPEEVGRRLRVFADYDNALEEALNYASHRRDMRLESRHAKNVGDPKKAIEWMAEVGVHVFPKGVAE